MLRARLITAAIALPPLIWLVCCAPFWLFSTVLLSGTGLGLYEYFSLTRAQNPLPLGFGLGWGITLAVSMLWTQAAAVGAVLSAGLFLAFVLALQDAQPSRAFSGVALTLFGVVYVGFLLPHLVWIRGGADGVAWVFFVFLVAMVGDTMGYIVGRMWGKHKLIPHVSPGKTLEGSAGSVVGNLAAAGAAWAWFLPHRPVWELLALGLVTGLLAQVGDLCESALKRALGAKDSGGFLPGHGGMLDRVDSLLFPAAFIYYYVTIWG